MHARTPSICSLTLALLGVSLLSACSSVPTPNAQLGQAKADYQGAAADPRTTRLAATELKRAQDALNEAQAAWDRQDTPEDVNHLAYLARQRVAIARETVALRSAEQTAASTGATRANIQLEARTQEADAAQRKTDQALAEATAAKQQSDRVQAQNQALQERLRELNAQPSPRGLVLTLGDVLFDIDKAQLKPAGLRLVRQLSMVLTDYPQRQVLIEGFTDNTGSTEHNLGLSGQRANAVRTALLGEGISAARVTTQSHGEARPVGDNNSADGRQLNRRVEIVLSDERGLISGR